MAAPTFLLPRMSVKKKDVPPPTSMPVELAPIPTLGWPMAASASDDRYGVTRKSPLGGRPFEASARYRATADDCAGVAGGRIPATGDVAGCTATPLAWSAAIL